MNGNPVIKWRKGKCQTFVVRLKRVLLSETIFLVATKYEIFGRMRVFAES